MFGSINPIAIYKEVKNWYQYNPSEFYNFRSIRYLHDITEDSKYNTVDDRTWDDLELNETYKSIDSSLTALGRQYLYREMRQFRYTDDELASNFQCVSKIKQTPKIKEEILALLTPIKFTAAKPIIQLCFDEKHSMQPVSVTAAFIWMLTCTALSTFAVFSGGLALTIFPILGLINFVTSHRLTKSNEDNQSAIYSVFDILSAASRIAKLKSLEELSVFSEFQSKASHITKVRNRLYLLSLNQESQNLVTSNVAYFANLIFATDIFIYSSTKSTIIGEIACIGQCVENLGRIDAYISIANYLDTLPEYCEPQFSSKALNLVDVKHPLVFAPVPNSIELTEKSALITGSNMSGKTTFIKTVGINVILARTLFFCLASEAQIPRVGVLTSIRGSDVLAEGKSFHFNELERILHFTKLHRSNGPQIILIDEIYRGTNTVERISSAAAVLDLLSKTHMVIATTHDIELEQMLQKRFQMLHFAETGDIEKPFDYTIRLGPCRTRNAILLMQRMGYPEEVVAKAKLLSSQITSSNTLSAKLSFPVSEEP